jgi:xanthine/uracil/vitamin C permease (AzgA family)
MPFTFSIADGIAFGFVSYAGIKLAAGRYPRCSSGRRQFSLYCS